MKMEAGHPPHNIREYRIEQGVVKVTRMDHFCDPKYPGHMAFTICCHTSEKPVVKK
jgi:hypothetical protein